MRELDLDRLFGIALAGAAALAQEAEQVLRKGRVFQPQSDTRWPQMCPFVNPGSALGALVSLSSARRFCQCARVLDRLPAVFLRIEGAAVFAAALVLYFDAGYEWWLFLLLALAPDIGGLGYLAGPRVGAAVYDTAHLELFPIALAVVGVLAENDLCIKLALIWLAHIGIDRAVGYGLKYPTHFKDTHIQRV